MVTLIFVAFGLGILVGLAALYTRTDLFKRFTDIKLKANNEYLTEEVKRLRAQVALYIGKDEQPLTATQLIANNEQYWKNKRATW